jgi:sulfate transport system permease protein
MPLRVEKLLQEYNLPGAFALASLLTLLALATLIVKVGLERKMQGNAAQALQSTSEELLVDARATIKESA